MTGFYLVQGNPGWSLGLWQDRAKSLQPVLHQESSKDFQRGFSIRILHVGCSAIKWRYKLRQTVKMFFCSHFVPHHWKWRMFAGLKPATDWQSHFAQERLQTTDWTILNYSIGFHVLRLDGSLNMPDASHVIPERNWDFPCQVRSPDRFRRV